MCSYDKLFICFLLDHEVNAVISGAVVAQWSGQHIYFLHCPRKHVQETAVLAHRAGQQLVGNWVCCGWAELKSRTTNGPALPTPPQWHLQQDLPNHHCL